MQQGLKKSQEPTVKAFPCCRGAESGVQWERRKIPQQKELENKLYFSDRTEVTHKKCFLFKGTDAQFPTIQKREVTIVNMQTKTQEAGHALLESIYTDYI